METHEFLLLAASFSITWSKLDSLLGDKKEAKTNLRWAILLMVLSIVSAILKLIIALI